MTIFAAEKNVDKFMLYLKTAASLFPFIWMTFPIKSKNLVPCILASKILTVVGNKISSILNAKSLELRHDKGQKFQFNNKTC